MSNWKATLLIVTPIVVGACTGAVAGQPAAQPSTPVAGMPATSVGTLVPGSTMPALVSPGRGTGAGASIARVTLHIAALNIAFDANHLTAPAGQPFAIDFANNDPGVPHNIDLVDGTGRSVFVGQIVMGPATVTYKAPALAAGTYAYHCDVHPEMTGTLTVK